VKFFPYNPITKEKRRIITYSKNNGINSSKKYIDANHVILAKRFEGEVNSPCI